MLAVAVILPEIISTLKAAQRCSQQQQPAMQRLRHLQAMMQGIPQCVWH
jgi:hypothetical protein